MTKLFAKENPLNNYRSYSYHFFLIVSQFSDDIQKMLNSENRNKLSRILTVKPGEKIPLGDKTNSYLILDTTRFTMFNIKSLEFNHIFLGADYKNPTVSSGDPIKMVLIDSTGFGLHNMLWEITTQKLKKSLENTYYTLGISFHGHTHDGEIDHIDSSYIPCALTEFEYNFGPAGAEYTLQFLETDGSIQQHEGFAKINSLCNISSITTSGGTPTIGTLISKLESGLNRQTSDEYVKLVNDAGVKFRPIVQYMINIPDEWKAFKITHAKPNACSQNTSKKDAPPQTTDTKWDKTFTTYTLPLNSKSESITEAIKKILETSEEFILLSSAANIALGKGVTYRISSNITESESVFMVHYDVYPVIIPKKSADGTIDSNSIKNLLELDYIFTGKNTDILDLNIKYDAVAAASLVEGMNTGQSALSNVAESGQIKRKQDALAKTSAKVNKNNVLDTGPVFVKSSKSGNRNLSGMTTQNNTIAETVEQQKARQEFYAVVADLHFRSSLSIELTIKGNPELLKKYTDVVTREFPPISSVSKSALVKASVNSNKDEALISTSGLLNSFINDSNNTYRNKFYRKRLESTKKDFPDVSVSPLYVKLNIKAPATDIGGTYFENSPMFTSEFFYKGAWTVLGIKTTLDNGNFTHVLSLTASPDKLQS